MAEGHEMREHSSGIAILQANGHTLLLANFGHFSVHNIPVWLVLPNPNIK
jgi:hypothetical protein